MIKCSNCNGKGHVADVFMIIMTSLVLGVGLLLYFMQKNQASGVTREVCCQCSGTGKLLNN